MTKEQIRQTIERAEALLREYEEFNYELIDALSHSENMPKESQLPSDKKMNESMRNSIQVTKEYIELLKKQIEEFTKLL